MEILRSLLFIPSVSIKMLDKINMLKPDGFILDLEDSIPANQKEHARQNISRSLKNLTISKKIFVRTNDLDSQLYKNDIKETICEKVAGFVIPKFENILKLKEVINFVESEENKAGINAGSIKIILMIESARGIIELNKFEQLKENTSRIMALTIGWEDFSRDIMVFSEISEAMLDYIRFQILLFSKAYDCLAIDTIYKEFKDSVGLEKQVSKIAHMGFNGKLAIHPSQIEIINCGFLPSKVEFEKMNRLLENRQRIEKEGAVSINGVMYDPPHLKLALKIKEYIDNINMKII